MFKFSRTGLIFVLLFFLGLALLLGLYLANPWGSRLPQLSASNPSSPMVSQALSPAAIEKIARRVTVRVISEAGGGSGVILSKQDQTYTVLTCKHVVEAKSQQTFTALTHDGKTHPLRLKSVDQQGLDLALLEFDSPVPYSAAALSPTPLPQAGDRLYAAGFPNYVFADAQSVEDTKDWGTRAFHLTQGNFLLKAERPLQGGYVLGSSNEVELGMSGGPLFNSRGEVVGINGRAKYPVQGSTAFVFADGSHPSPQIAEKMEAVSWAIPIAEAAR